MKLKRKLRLAGIDPESIVDGPGIRAVIFCQGCVRKCHGCQNQSTWPVDAGYEIGNDEIFRGITVNPLCKGVTFSGGEPFLQAEALTELAVELKRHGYEVACYTGYLFEELAGGTDEQKMLLEQIDVLIDGPFIESERSMDLLFKGSRNQRIIDVRKSIREGRAVLMADGRWTR